MSILFAYTPGVFPFCIFPPITIWWVNMSTLCIHDLIQSIHQELFNTNVLHFCIHPYYFICKLLNSSFRFIIGISISIRIKGFFCWMNIGFHSIRILLKMNSFESNHSIEIEYFMKIFFNNSNSQISQRINS